MKKIILLFNFACALSMLVHAQQTFLQASTSDSTVLANLHTGLKYMSGDSLVEKDYKEAVKYLRKAAQKDEVVAQYFLAFAFEKGGYGIKRNVQQALHWYERCANNGVDEALCRYALLLFKNEGNPSNYRKAIECFSRAAENGNLNGIYSLGYMHFKGLGTKQDYDMAIAYFREAASQNHVPSVFFLGYFYEMGFGVEKDLDYAMEAYRFAALNNYEQAINRLAEIESKATKTVSIADYEKLEAEFIEQGLFPEHHIQNNVIDDVSGIDMVGKWEGIIYSYDWAGWEVMKRQSVEMTIEQNGSTYYLSIEADYTQTSRNAQMIGNKLIPDNLMLVVEDALYEYSDLNIKSLVLEHQHVDEQVYLTGSIESFIPAHQEPGLPSYLIMKKVVNTPKVDMHLETAFGEKLDMNVYPNPFQNTLNLWVSIQEPSTVEVHIYDLQGRLVTTMLQKTTLQEGEHNFVFDEVLPEGMYIFDLIHDNEHHVKRIIKN